MGKYELTLVLPGKSKPTKKKSVHEKLEKIVKSSHGKLGKIEDWGEIELAYPIKKNDSGIFMHFLLELDGSGAKGLGEKLNLENDIIRYLLIRKD